MSRLILLFVMLTPTIVLAAGKISVNDAFIKAQRNELILIDIRSRNEWEERGIASVARPVSMHESQFLAKFNAILQEANGRPIALICAVGGRTAWLQKQLSNLGFSNILDVSEGMNGSSYGPGWLRSGLPIKNYSTSSSPSVTSETYTFWERFTGTYKPPWLKDGAHLDKEEGRGADFW